MTLSCWIIANFMLWLIYLNTYFDKDCFLWCEFLEAKIWLELRVSQLHRNFDQTFCISTKLLIVANRWLFQSINQSIGISNASLALEIDQISSTCIWAGWNTFQPAHIHVSNGNQHISFKMCWFPKCLGYHLVECSRVQRTTRLVRPTFVLYMYWRDMVICQPFVHFNWKAFDRYAVSCSSCLLHFHCHIICSVT